MSEAAGMAGTAGADDTAGAGDTVAVADAAGPDVVIRPARPDDLDECMAIRTGSISEYQARLGLDYQARDANVLREVLGHILATDPGTFAVAEESGEATAGLAGFGAATIRGRTWFLGALFLRPGRQGVGIGRRLLDAVWAADAVEARMTCTDALQPVSNAMYATRGVVPREPLFRLSVPDAGMLASVADGREWMALVPGGAAWIDSLDDIDELDGAVVGYRHRDDHRFVAAHSSACILVRHPSGRLDGYAYAHADGSIGPAASRSANGLAAIVGAIARTCRPGEALALWVGGAAGDTFAALLRSGAQIRGYPALACWSEPRVDLSRYLPWTLTLL